jgi:hypothetical protein
MSELDTGLEELRTDLRAAIRRPDLGQVATRARQQRMRRRTQIGAMVAVVLVIVAVPLLRSTSRHQPADPPEKQTPSYDYQIDFADTEHGYALGSDCDSASFCLFTLLATTNRGKSWAPRTLPKISGKYEGSYLRVFGQSQLAFELVLSTGETIEEFLSDDAGRTWRKFEVNDVGAPGRIPSGATLMQVCVGHTVGGACVSGVGVMVADKGELSPTPAQPSLVDPVQAGGAPTAGGRYWAAGKDSRFAGWAIAVSSDAGVTWATTPLDVPGTPSSTTGDAWSVVELGGAMYATVRGAIGSGPSGLLAVFRSTDHGVSWTRMWNATPTAGLAGVTGSPIATTDGRLFVWSSVTGTFTSSDGGRTFTRSSVLLLGPVMWTRGGYLMREPERGYAISHDGLSWRPFVLP